MNTKTKPHINRFFEKITPPPGINFELNFGDVLSKDGIIHIATGWGIYDNQMWVEKIRDNICELCEGGYELADKTMQISDIKIINHAKTVYKKAMIENYNKFKFMYRHISKKQFNHFLKQFN